MMDRDSEEFFNELYMHMLYLIVQVILKYIVVIWKMIVYWNTVMNLILDHQNGKKEM